MDVRKEALVALKKHKSGWIKLGETLGDIESKEMWKDWGFEGFNDYCKKELGITPRTAADMIAAYEYIKKNEPSVLATVASAGGEAKYIPDYYSVSNLAKAAERGGEERKDEVNSLHSRLFEDQVDAKGASNAVRDFLKDCKGGKGGDVMDTISKETKSVQRLAKKLVDKLQNTSAFEPEILAAAEELEKKIEAVGV